MSTTCCVCGAHRTSEAFSSFQRCKVIAFSRLSRLELPHAPSLLPGLVKLLFRLLFCLLTSVTPTLNPESRWRVDMLGDEHHLLRLRDSLCA